MHKTNSKILTDNEKKLLNKQLLETPLFVKSVNKLYPVMQKKMSMSKELFTKNFNDTSDLFKKEKHEIYVDGAAHLNKRGNEMLASFISKIIYKQFTSN